MQASTLLLIIGSVAMSAFAQILLKTGMSDARIAVLLSDRRWAELALQVGGNAWVVLGLGLYFLSALVWLGVLARVEVSFAYPFVGLGFILTMLLGWLLMGDQLGPQRIAGTLLVAGGVLLIARGG